MSRGQRKRLQVAAEEHQEDKDDEEDETLERSARKRQASERASSSKDDHAEEDEGDDGWSFTQTQPEAFMLAEKDNTATEKLKEVICLSVLCICS